MFNFIVNEKCYLRMFEERCTKLSSVRLIWTEDLTTFASFDRIQTEDPRFLFTFKEYFTFVLSWRKMMKLNLKTEITKIFSETLTEK